MYSCSLQSCTIHKAKYFQRFKSWEYKHKHLTGPSFLCLHFFLMFSEAFFKNGHEKRLKYLLMVFFFTQSYLSSPSLWRMCSKIKTYNQIQFFTPEYMHTWDELDNVHFNYKFKVFTILNIKRINHKSFYRILLLLSGDVSLNSRS